MAQPQGETLAQRLERGPLESRVALDVLEHLLEALAVFHAGGAVHGDITPNNISLSPDGQVTLKGFEYWEAGEESGQARAGREAYTPGYAAPEQVAGDSFDRRADIFALGVIGYEMLAGKNPFGASEALPAGTIIYRMLYKPVPQIPDATVAGLPRDIRPALSMAMADVPSSRFPDAESFLDALRVEPDEAAAAAALVTAGPGAPRRSRGLGAFAAWMFTSRRKWLPYSIAAGVLIVVLIAVVLLLAYGGQTTTVTETTVAQPTATTAVASLSTETTTTTAPPDTTTTAPPETTTTVSVSTTTSTSAATPGAKLPATITLSGLTHTYTGSAIAPSATTDPAGLKVLTSYSRAGSAVSAPTNAGSYTVTATIDDSGYEGSATGTLTISKANAIVNIAGWTGTYTGTSHGATGTARGVRGENLTSRLTYGSTFTNAPGGTASWSFAGGGNYNNVSGSVRIVINKATLSVNAAAKSKTYGNTDPALTYTFSGFKSTDTATNSGITGTAAISRTAGQNAGSYLIGVTSVGGLNAVNYTFAIGSTAYFTINPRPVAVAANNQSKTEGDPDPAFTYHITSGSLVTGDGFSGFLSRDNGEAPGSYSILRGNLTLGSNYALTFLAGTLTIFAAPTTTTTTETTTTTTTTTTTETTTTTAAP